MTEIEITALSQRMNKMPRERLVRLAAPLSESDRKRMGIDVAGFLLDNNDSAFSEWWLKLSEPELAFLKLMRRG
jgi:hypothetical protein